MAAPPFTLQRTIPAPPEQVKAVLSNLDVAREWMPSIQNIRQLDDKPMAPGKAWVETRRDPDGKPMVGTIRVTEFTDGRMAFELDHRRMAMNFSFEFAPVDGGTQVNYMAEGGLKGFWSLFNGKLRKAMAQQDGDLLDRLAVQVAKTGAVEASPSTPRSAARRVTEKSTTPKGASARHAGGGSASKATAKKGGRAKR